MLKKYRDIKTNYDLGKRYQNDLFHIDGYSKSIYEMNKNPLRTEIINFLLASFNKKETTYLEIGVRFPEENFNQIKSTVKYGVDPGLENKENPVDFKLTSDAFFEQLRAGKVLNSNFKFDVIFIDGLHLADQVDLDIINSLEFINDDGFIVLHDCNPPTEFHSLESHAYKLSPARGYWNGTTWKAFFKWRQKAEVYSCCVDTDWGIGVISKKINFGKKSETKNSFFEYNVLNQNRTESLNLITYSDFMTIINSKKI